MGHWVLDQAGSIAEALPTHEALVGPFPCVDLLVLDQVAAQAEALLTFPTLIGLFPCVLAHVGDEMGVLAEALPTFHALIGSFSCVYLVVEVVGVAEALPHSKHLQSFSLA